jgi:hypothetical protein
VAADLQRLENEKNRVKEETKIASAMIEETDSHIGETARVADELSSSMITMKRGIY